MFNLHTCEEGCYNARVKGVDGCNLVLSVMKKLPPLLKIPHLKITKRLQVMMVMAIRLALQASMRLDDAQSEKQQ